VFAIAFCLTMSSFSNYAFFIVLKVDSEWYCIHRNLWPSIPVRIHSIIALMRYTQTVFCILLTYQCRITLPNLSTRSALLTSLIDLAYWSVRKFREIRHLKSFIVNNNSAMDMKLETYCCQIHAPYSCQVSLSMQG